MGPPRQDRAGLDPFVVEWLDRMDAQFDSYRRENRMLALTLLTMLFGFDVV